MVNYKKIDGFVNYEISNEGNVFNTKTGRILKQELSKGYLRTTLSGNGKTKRFQSHVLIALSFIPNPNNKKCVNHIDGNKLNNRVENLEWVTHSENEKHSYVDVSTIYNVIKGKYYVKNS